MLKQTQVGVEERMKEHHYNLVGMELELEQHTIMEMELGILKAQLQ